MTIYARDFGCDPTGTLDKPDNLQAFLDAAIGKRAEFGAGTFLVSRELIYGRRSWTPLPNYPYPPNDATSGGGVLLGEGQHGTTLKWIGANNDGSCMLRVSAPRSRMGDFEIHGGSKASQGIVLHNSNMGRLVNANVHSCVSHGIRADGMWRSSELWYGFNEQFQLDGIDAGNNGRVERQVLKIQGASLSGSYKLTWGGITTGPIAWNAAGAAVQTALNAAFGLTPAGYSRLACPNAAFTPQSPGGREIIFQGDLCGPQAMVVLDATGITGTITLAAITSAVIGSFGCGFWTDEGCGSDNGTMTLRNFNALGNAGHGIALWGQGIRVEYPHCEGNCGAGITIIGHRPGTTPTDSLVVHPWLEANQWAGAITFASARNRFAFSFSGSQRVVCIDEPQYSADVEDYTGNGVIIQRDPHDGTEIQTYNSTGTGQIFQARDKAGKNLPIKQPMTVTYPATITHAPAAGAPLDLVLDPNRSHHKITLRANAVLALPAPPRPYGVLFLDIGQDASGGHQMTLPTNVRMMGGGHALTLLAQPNKHETLILQYEGVSWIQKAPLGPPTG